MSKAFCSICVALFLVGCASAPSYDEAQVNATPLPAENARVYFLRESKFTGALVDHPFQIDGIGKYEIPNGSFFFVDVPSGDYVLRSSSAMLPGEYVISLKAESRATYYVKVDYRQKNAVAVVGASLLGGALLGWVVQASEAKKNDGPFTLTPLAPEQAKELMRGLKHRQG